MVWFITGCSSGFGKELARQLLEKGEQVVATARNLDSLQDLDSEKQLLKLSLDITDQSAVESAVKEAISRFERIDVLINNAGYGLGGGLEEASDEQIRAQFETNVFGTIQVTKAILPLMREQKSGYIQVLSSIAGLVSTPGFAYYNGSKFALEGMFEALQQEVRPFGIKVTIVEPGPFRTEFAGSSIKLADPIPAYAETAGKIRNYFDKTNGNQLGDPVKAAEILIGLVERDEPPLRLLLGNWAVDRYTQKLETELKHIKAWEELSRSADFDD
ncbi:oxidoreductase [Siphonobacter sp. SORGH_AS_1065]|uniref:oxidoreductase n=1 Tax=Siphonobacter sp. SORGH_AS_1065 TaxID=3041795 RepID=UPI00278AF745|nr:oxidoreductase [Siphonobacter sp. SORGH_AS_1065]MDQ1086397.1 NADP-dependent 3-hydroxy acid dehydrogenase YdfG [Siphonobacter sp. SORGH_AS_1065]